jgi:hypothetical protein
MTEIVDVFPLADRAAWVSAHHSAGGLPSQSWEYCHALAASGIESKLARVRSDNSTMLLPFFERQWNGTTDICTVLGLSGTSINPASPAPLALWSDWSRKQAWVAGYIQLAAGTPPIVCPEGDKLALGNKVFLLPVVNDPKEQWLHTSAIIRRKIAKGERSGAGLVQDLPANFEALRQFYPATMRRVKARTVYDLSDETLRRLVMSKGSLVLGAEIKGRISAVTVFLVSSSEAEYYII